MKTAIYIEDGLFQVILTPESDHEKAVTKSLTNKDLDLTIKKGGFYSCQGGHDRMENYPDNYIIKFEEKA